VPSAAGHSRLETTCADREHVIGMLKAAFVQGRLTQDELDERLGEAFASRTRAELAVVVADLPATLAAGQPPEPARRPVNMSVRSGVCVLLVAFMLTALIAGAGLAGPAADARACEAFSAWTGPAPHHVWLLDAAVAAARQGPNRNLLDDLRALQRLVWQSGGSPAQWTPSGSVQDSRQSPVDDAYVLVRADCTVYYH
jgi:Domain of unknown function (DUF1707)